MYWQSILNGLAILGHWRIWIAVLIYVMLTLVFKIIRGRILESNFSNNHVMISYAIMMFGEPVILVVLTSFFIALTIRIIIGADSYTTPVQLLNIMPSTLAGCFIGLIALIGLGFSPFIGPFLERNPSIQTFIISAVTFRILLVKIADQFSTDEHTVELSFPGLFNCIGYLIISFIAARLLMYLLIFLYWSCSPDLRWKLKYGGDITSDPIMLFFGGAVANIGGFLPFYMFAQFAAQSFNQNFN